MPDYLHKYFKTFLESGFISRNKNLILVLLFGSSITTVGGIQEARVQSANSDLKSANSDLKLASNTLKIINTSLYERSLKPTSKPTPVIIRQEVNESKLLEKCGFECQGIVDKHEYNYHGRRQ
jgi:hypothetical protein